MLPRWRSGVCAASFGNKAPIVGPELSAGLPLKPAPRGPQLLEGRLHSSSRAARSASRLESLVRASLNRILLVKTLRFCYCKKLMVILLY